MPAGCCGHLDTLTGQVRRGRISPACRETLRRWLEWFAGRDDVTFGETTHKPSGPLDHDPACHHKVAAAAACSMRSATAAGWET
jgi:hypothetical protein